MVVKKYYYSMCVKNCTLYKNVYQQIPSNEQLCFMIVMIMIVVEFFVPY